MIKTLVFGLLSALMYWGLIQYSGDVAHLAQTTPDACIVGQGADTQYYPKASAEACAEKGGTLQAGNWLLVLIPIVIAFAMSYVHGAFTGLFWDVVGLKAKK